LRQRTLRVLEGWQLDPEFTGKTGRPAKLNLGKSAPSFGALVRRYGGDVTPIAVLRELERMRAVVRSASGELRLAYSGRRGADPELLEFAQLIRDFAESITDRGNPNRPPLFRGFREAVVSSPDQVALFRRTFARRGVALLDGVTDWVVSQTRTRQIRFDEPFTVGLGVYLIERGAKGTARARR
jgi:hypothetical protein